jgi:ribosomal protection tetracycline resistance protein
LRRTVNLGILAHIDAGKTSLTERLLHTAGVIGELGSVDDGNTQTDSLALERQRGITIKSAVVSFRIEDVTVNLIDTPGHPDFIAEVERSLSVLDGAILVISAVEGVQAQTRVLMRALRRLRIPTLIFVNKIDRGGARYETLLESISSRLTPAIVPMGPVSEIGTRGASATAFDAANADFISCSTDLLTRYDDALLSSYVADPASISIARLQSALAAQTRQARVHPVFFGSAITGAGLAALTDGIRQFLPPAPGDPDGPTSGAVFKVERGPAGEKIAYVRMFSGTVHVRDRVRFGTAEGKVTGISVFDQGPAVRGMSVVAGQIGKIWGLDVRIGDTIGTPSRRASHQFAPPTLQTVVIAVRSSDKGALHSALTHLAEQDPLIDFRHDRVSLYGEVQKEVVQATLADEYGIDVEFEQTTTICVERLAGTGSALEVISTGGNPYLATVGLRVSPSPQGSGIRFALEVELGSMPYAFFRAVEETVHETLRQGVHGWEVGDCLVTMTHSGYWARQSHSHATFDKSMSSTAGDFRYVTPLVLMDALRQAGTVVHEPIHRFHLEVPADTLDVVQPALSRVRAIPLSSTMQGPVCVLTGDIPAARVHDLERLLPSVARGEGMLESSFDHYSPVRGAVPSRPRTDRNPLNRKEYLQLTRR